MPQQYKCMICDSKPDQLSHHKSHLKTSKHKDKKELFKLQLEKLTKEELEEKYKTNKIEDIVKDNETIMKDTSLSEILKKNVSGKILWTLDLNKDTNLNYNTIKSQLDSIIKKCHQLLYSKGGSIVGSKAQNDIMRILCLKILQPQFNDKESPLYNRCLSVKTKMNISEKQFEKYMLFCSDLDEITKLDDIMREWKLFIQKFISNVFPSIYFENDEKFNCDKCICISDLIHCINSLEITEKFKDAFSTTCGDIHESFREYGGGKGAKELGQYFTPRQLIHLIFHGIGLDKLLNKISNITIYDPCMGTGGFLTRLFKLCDIPSHNIYGCETESDTIKFGNMSMVLTTGSVENNIIKCDSLCENQFIVNKNFSVIVTNPPFGTKMKYDELKKTFEETIKDVKFEDVYQLKTNNGACLFIQHCVYMLEENGVCAIVLPDGELFEGNSKWSKAFRKWWTNNVNIQTILKVPSGTFEHAGVKTNVVVFVKNGPTKNIQFIETTKECNMVKDMFTITMDELCASNYSLDVGEYVVEDKVLYDVPMVALGDVCEFLPKSKRNAKYGNKEGLFPFFKSSVILNSYINEPDYNEESLIIGDGGQANINYSHKFSASDHCYILQNNNKLKLLLEYSYYYLYFNLNKMNNLFTGSGIKNISKEKLRNLEIPLPSLEVQKQIVDELSLLETSIQTIETRVSQLKMEKEQYKKYGRKAEIRELLKDSEEVALGDVCRVNYGKRITKNKDEGTEYFAYGGGDLMTYKVNQYNRDGITYKISRDGLSRHNCIKKIYGKIFLNDTALTLDTLDDKRVNNYYIGEYLLNEKSYIYDNCTHGMAQLHIDINKLLNFKIPLPSQEVQQQCIELFEQKETYIQSIDDKIVQEKKYIEELKQLAKDVISTHC